MGRPTVIVCVDGLDPRYLETCDTPNLRRLSRDGFLQDGKCMMPSVTNVNNVSLLTAGYPEDHGICTNYLWDRSRGEGAYMESGEYVQRETIFQRAARLGKRASAPTAPPTRQPSPSWGTMATSRASPSTPTGTWGATSSSGLWGRRPSPRRTQGTQTSS